MRNVNILCSGVVTGGGWQDTRWCSAYTVPPCNHFKSRNNTLPNCEVPPEAAQCLRPGYSSRPHAGHSRAGLCLRTVCVGRGRAALPRRRQRARRRAMRTRRTPCRSSTTSASSSRPTQWRRYADRRRARRFVAARGRPALRPHVLTRKQEHARRHARTSSRTHSCKLTLIHTNHKDTLMHARKSAVQARARTHSHTRRCARTRTSTCTRADAHAPAHSHARTHTRSA
jgi:hypothetical protein